MLSNCPTLSPFGQGRLIYRNAVLADRPVAYWTMEDTGSVLTDVRGGYNGSFYGTPSKGQAGVISRAIVFDGSTNCVDVPFNAALNTDTWSIECWARCDGGSGAYRSPITSRSQTSGMHGYFFYAASSNVWALWIGTGAGWAAIWGPAVVLGQTVHLVGTYDGTNLTLYINGVVAVPSAGQNPLALSFSKNVDKPLRIGSGASEQAAPGVFGFPGMVDEVAYYNYALSATQVANHYKAAFAYDYRQQVKADGASNYWSIRNPTIAVDEIGGMNLTLMTLGGSQYVPTLTADGRGLHFPGNHNVYGDQSQGSLFYGNAANVADLSKYAIEGWFRTAAVPETAWGNQAEIFGNFLGNSQRPMLQWDNYWVETLPQSWICRAGQGGGNEFNAQMSTVSLNVWHHSVGVVYNGILTAYLDGQQVAQVTITGMNNATTQPLIFVGGCAGEAGGSGYGSCFNGDIRDVAVYSGSAVDNLITNMGRHYLLGK